MQDKKLKVASLILLIFHAVGFWGLAFSSNPAWFKALSPLNLLLTLVLLFAFHPNWNRAFAGFAVVVLLTGFFAEVVGVHTQLLFGHYRYGASLGPKLWDIPLLIAANWLLLVYVTGIVTTAWPLPWLLRALLSAGLMVLLDLFIEPSAAVLDFWTWHNYRIPATNYWGWFGVGAVLQVYFHRAPFRKENPLAVVVYSLQLLFFIGLYLAL